jgi:hypothetical protein
MLLKFKSDLQAFVVGDTTVEPIIHHRIGDFHSSGEDLVKMTTQPVGDRSVVKCKRESQVVHFPVNVLDVVNEVTSYHNRRFRILFDDILDDISHPFCPLNLERFLPWFEVAVYYLHHIPASGHSCPAQVGPQGFYKGHVNLVGYSHPSPTVPLQYRLVGPVMVKVYGDGQLGLIEAYHIWLFLVNEFTYHFLLFLPIETPDVKAHQGKLLQFILLVIIIPCSAVVHVRLPRFPLFLIGYVRLPYSTIVLLGSNANFLHCSVALSVSTCYSTVVSSFRSIVLFLSLVSTLLACLLLLPPFLLSLLWQGVI